MRHAILINFLTIFTLLFLTAFNSHSAENRYNADLRILQDILENQHPDLYAYSNKKDFESLFVKQFTGKEPPKSFYKHLLKIISLLGDGHSEIIPAESFIEQSSQQKVFIPISVRILNSDIYVNSHRSNIPFGAKILSINALNSADILNKCYEILSADAKSITYKNRLIEENFDLYLYFIEDKNDIFQIEYVFKDQIFNKQLKAATKQAMPQQQYQDYEYKKINNKTYYLDINSFFFGENQHDFEVFLDDFFSAMKKEKTENLIIDIRGNQGGLRENTVLLYSYLTNQKFTQRLSAHIKSKKIDPTYIVNMERDEIEGIEEYLQEHFAKNKNISDNLQALMIPQKEFFDKNVFVLIDGNTFSAGAEFALLAKNDKRIKLIGKEESGGNYYQHVGDISFVYILPNTESFFKMSLVGIKQFAKDKNSNKNAGIMPDVLVRETYQDFITNNDVVWQRVLSELPTR
jgi:hypothetical protein